jgi:hypothetical protein
MPVCKFCGRQGRYYREEPSDYGSLQDWAEKMMKTHHQERCPGCQRYTVWKKGPAQEVENAS